MIHWAVDLLIQLAAKHCIILDSKTFVCGFLKYERAGIVQDCCLILVSCHRPIGPFMNQSEVTLLALIWAWSVTAYDWPPFLCILIWRVEWCIVTNACIANCNASCTHLFGSYRALLSWSSAKSMATTPTFVIEETDKLQEIAVCMTLCLKTFLRSLLEVYWTKMLRSFLL